MVIDLMFTVEEIQKIIDEADRQQLDGREILHRLPPEELCTVCNGIGPDNMPVLSRVATALHPELVPTSAIHDLRWYFAEGTREDFEDSNAQYAANGRRAADACHCWWSLRRYHVRGCARRQAALCSYSHYMKCYRARLEREAHAKHQ